MSQKFCALYNLKNVWVVRCCRELAMTEHFALSGGICTSAQIRDFFSDFAGNLKNCTHLAHPAPPRLGEGWSLQEEAPGAGRPQEGDRRGHESKLGQRFGEQDLGQVVQTKHTPAEISCSGQSFVKFSGQTLQLKILQEGTFCMLSKSLKN